MKRTLFEIADDIRALEELLVEADGDISDAETERIFDEFFANLGAELDRKLDGYAYLIKEREAMAEIRLREALRMEALATADKNFADRLKRRLQVYFESQGKPKHETLNFKFTIAKNGGKAPLVIADNVKPEDVPECFRKVTVDFNTTVIRSALEQGEPIEWATLKERGSHLRIK